MAPSAQQLVLTDSVQDCACYYTCSLIDLLAHHFEGAANTADMCLNTERSRPAAAVGASTHLLLDILELVASPTGSRSIATSAPVAKLLCMLSNTSGKLAKSWVAYTQAPPFMPAALVAADGSANTLILPANTLGELPQDTSERASSGYYCLHNHAIAHQNAQTAVCTWMTCR